MANSILYGVYQLKDYQNQRAIDVAPDDLRRATIMSAAAYNEQVQTLINLFARPTTSYKVRFGAAANARLQPGDQNARALAVKRSTYDVALPLQMGTHAWGVNYVTRYKRTVADDAKDTNLAFQADQNWMADHILGGLFYNGAGWTFTDEQYGALTINGLANGDTRPVLAAGRRSRDGQSLPRAGCGHRGRHEPVPDDLQRADRAPREPGRGDRQLHQRHDGDGGARHVPAAG
jgi:hypothetical protein